MNSGDARLLGACLFFLVSVTCQLCIYYVKGTGLGGKTTDLENLDTQIFKSQLLWERRRG